jgi:hypothetical protein
MRDRDSLAVIGCAPLVCVVCAEQRGPLCVVCVPAEGGFPAGTHPPPTSACPYRLCAHARNYKTVAPPAEVKRVARAMGA